MIVPNTTIKILKNVPLDNTYKDTVYFANVSSQQSFFNGKVKYTLNNYTYQRQNKAIRVGINTESLFDCNYIMFQNTSFGNKWFYAFITGIEYVNNQCAEIVFELDVMQTWFFDYTVKPSFIEREHSVTDNIGDNLVPENVELGEYTNQSFLASGHISNGGYKIIVASTFKYTENNGVGSVEDVQGGIYGGVYSGLYYNVCDDSAQANKVINTATIAKKSDGIISVFMMPTNFVTERGSNNKSYETLISKSYENIDGYTPKNKKLYTYPYNFLYVTDLNGNYAEFKYEHFTDSRCAFHIAGDMSCNPEVVLIPKNYKGIKANYNEKMHLNGYPQCAYANDTFQAWLAQNSSSLAVSMLGSAFTTGAGIVTANPLMAVGGAIGVAGTIAQVTKHSGLPRQAHGSTSGSTAIAMGFKDFAFIHMCIRREFAMIIDEYFTMYGYATHRVKEPNISSRPHWNYVKTIDVNIVGSVPVNDMVSIKKAYNNGITFWKSGNSVGNYGLNNSV